MSMVWPALSARRSQESSFFFFVVWGGLSKEVCQGELLCNLLGQSKSQKFFFEFLLNDLFLGAKYVSEPQDAFGRRFPCALEKTTEHSPAWSGCSRWLQRRQGDIIVACGARPAAAGI